MKAIRLNLSYKLATYNCSALPTPAVPPQHNAERVQRDTFA